MDHERALVCGVVVSGGGVCGACQCVVVCVAVSRSRVRFQASVQRPTMALHGPVPWSCLLLGLGPGMLKQGCWLVCHGVHWFRVAEPDVRRVQCHHTLHGPGLSLVCCFGEPWNG